MKRASIVITAITALVVCGTLAVSALASTRSVSVKDDVFAAKSLTVNKGTTVKWVWKGHAPHNVTVTKGPSTFHSKTQTTGTYSKKFTRAGTYRIVCTIHAPRMSMTVKVH